MAIPFQKNELKLRTELYDIHLNLKVLHSPSKPFKGLAVLLR